MEDNKEIIKEENKSTNKFKEIFNKIPYKPVIILVFLLIIAIIIPRRLPKFFEEKDYSKIQKISELATLEVYYHDVAYKEEPRNSILGIIGDYGYYKYWLEYDSIIKVGIDANKVEIQKPNMLNEVKVKIPEAQVIGEPIELTEYMGEPITDSGFLTSIKPEAKSQALGKAKADLKEEVSNDTELLNQARDRAKDFFKNYIESIGKEIGVNYKVIFED